MGPTDSSAVLPGPAQRYLERVLPPAGFAPRHVRLRQRGEMWLKPGGRPHRFAALEELAVEEVAFRWQARVAFVPGISLRVVDRYAPGAGLLEVRVAGLVPIVRARGEDVAAGEALRYLAELAWVPQAILGNRELEWRELDDRTVEVGTKVDTRMVALRLEFDAAGDIVGVRCDARPRMEGKQATPTPWAGTFGDYAVVGGVRVPTRGEVRWELPDGPFVYWRCEFTSLELAQS